MNRIHPDDIQAIAERVVLLMKCRPATELKQLQNEVDPLTAACIRNAARSDLAQALARKQNKRRAA